MEFAKRRSRYRGPMLAAAIALASALPALAQGQMSIAQVDPSQLLTRQKVDVYVSVTGPHGNAVTGLRASDFSMFEGSPGGKLLPVNHFAFHEGAPANEGITFFLLVDNSGSMYEPLSGGPAGAPQQTRIEAARSAIRTFLNSVDNPADRIGVAAFNTLYRVETPPTQVRSETEAALAKIKRPSNRDAYTELYASLEAAAHDLSGWKGRKVIILLTDGENFPYYTHTGRPNPQFGKAVVSSGQAVKELIRDGVSVFPIHFGPARQDANLQSIAVSTGGRVFDARNEKELADVYLSVRKRVLAEYRLTYTPRMIPGDRREVRVEYHGPGGNASASQYYFVGTLFGPPSGPLSPLLILPFLAALLLWFLVTRLRFLDRRRDASLEVIGGGGTKVFPLAGGRTVIDFDAAKQVTIASVDESAAGGAPPGGKATVVKDQRTGSFTVMSDAPVMVNNRATQRRTLRPGDVLRIGETTIVFDDRSDEGDRPPK